LFGARFKTDGETKLIKELSKVSADNNKGITFTDWDKSSSATLAQFKKKVGAKQYQEAKIKYGRELKSQLSIVINKSSYQQLSDEDKLKVINGKDSDVMNKIFKDYNFKYKPVKSNKLPSDL